MEFIADACCALARRRAVLAGPGTCPGADGGGLRAVATDTSMNPSAEPASMIAASKRAKYVRMVASSTPVSLAKALA